MEEEIGTTTLERIAFNPLFTTQKPPPKELMPRIAVTQTAILEMFQEVIDHPDIETSWGIYGLLYPNDTAVIAGVIKPRKVTRAMSTTVFGDDSYGQEVMWFKKNFRLMYPDSEIKPVFLLKGHSHHKMGLRTYSGTDHDMVRDAIKEGMGLAIGPLANIDKAGGWVIHETHEEGTLAVNFYHKVSFHFYVLTRTLYDAGYTRPVLVTPQVIETTLELPPACWIFTSPDLYDRELDLFKKHGFEVSVDWFLDKKPPLQVRFSLKKKGWKNNLFITTSHDYPSSRPKFDPENQSGFNFWFYFPRGDSLAEKVKFLEERGALNGTV